MTSIMAKFEVTATRTGQDTYRVDLIIHGTEVVASTLDLPFSDMLYEYCFDIVKEKINESVL